MQPDELDVAECVDRYVLLSVSLCLVCLCLCVSLAPLILVVSACVCCRIEQMTTLNVRRIGHKWSGLRSFVKDKDFVLGVCFGVRVFVFLLQFASALCVPGR